MSTASPPYFFISYSREDTSLQQKVVRELRERGVHVWVDVENLIPGTPAWEREVERSIRGAAGVIVLLSPGSNDSEWVRREISFAEENDKRIFPVLIRGDENDSIPLRLSAHQRVDLRRNFEQGLDYLADTLKGHLGTTLVNQPIKLKKGFDLSKTDFKKLALPGLLAIVGLACLGGLIFTVKGFKNIPTKIPVKTVTPGGTDATLTKTATGSNEPTGKIIYTCSLQGDEVCIINPDGSGWKRLTDTNFASFNASLSPDGQKAVYIVNNGKTSEVYEMDLKSGKSKQLTNLGRNVGSPEISPDNQFIIFHYLANNNTLQLWIMNRDSGDQHKFYSSSGKDAHDATWSPDGAQILFALGKTDSNKLYTLDLNGGDPHLLNTSIDTRGRSDWSAGDRIVLDQGGPWLHEVYLMNADGSNLHQVSPAGMNSQGASLSPDGNWIAFTAYTDVKNQDLNSCEIFIMRVDGTDLRQLTNNSYCDYQPRWGN